MINLIKQFTACEMKNSRLMVINAMLWAGAILATSIVLKGSEQSEAIFWILLTTSTASFLYFQAENTQPEKDNKNHWI